MYRVREHGAFLLLYSLWRCGRRVVQCKTGMHLFFLWCLPLNAEIPQMAGNSDLHQANRAKKDEFYTQLVDIEAELRHYRKHFSGKTVFCNCDDPYESNFFRAPLFIRAKQE